jgi:hypothetical protein
MKMFDKMTEGTIDSIELNRLQHSAEDDLGGWIPAGGVEVRIEVTGPDGRWDEYQLTLEHWAEFRESLVAEAA